MLGRDAALHLPDQLVDDLGEAGEIHRLGMNRQVQVAVGEMAEDDGKRRAVAGLDPLAQQRDGRFHGVERDADVEMDTGRQVPVELVIRLAIGPEALPVTARLRDQDVVQKTFLREFGQRF